MALLLAKKLSRSFQLPTPHFRVTLLPVLRLSTAADQTKDTPFITQYLISSFGFSPDRALRLASWPYLSPVKTSDRPESVVRFLKENGLTDSQIKTLISWTPILLGCSVSNTLEPNLQKLVAGGFTGETLTQLIRTCPNTLLLKSAIPRLKFWRDFAGNDDILLKIIQVNSRLLNVDIEVVLPTINLLKDSGFSDVDIRRLYISISRTLKCPDAAMKLTEQTEALGFDRKSGMFLYGLIAVGKQNSDTIKRKLEFFRNSYGWSDEELHAAFKKFPNLVNQTEKTLKVKIDFLLDVVGLENKHIMFTPQLLGHSLEKRLVPRHHVLNLLKIKDIEKRASFVTVVRLSESVFFEKFVIPYKNQIPELEEVYAASCQGKMSL